MSDITVKWKYYKFWGKFHDGEDNTCFICGNPAYRMWDKRYNGYRGFCTTCDSNWPES